MGTISYLSPEQARGQVCDPRSDLYALGIVFYELLTGKPPFRGDDASAVIYQHVHEPPPDLRQHQPRIPHAVCAIVGRLLAKDPAQRYQAAGEVVADLERVQQGRAPIHVRTAGGGRRGPLIAGTVAAAIVLGLIGWSLRSAPAVDPTLPTIQGTGTAPAAPAPVAPRSKARSDAFGSYTDLPIAGVGFRLRRIEPGEVRIGSPADEAGRSRDEEQAVVRFTKPWWLADTEVTQAQRRAVMGDLPEQEHPGDDLPVTGIERAQAESFCARLAILHPGLSASLPGEAAWEFAARAGSETPFANGRPLPTLGWYDGNADGRPHPPRQFPPNAWGLYDMHGNVAEWVAEPWGPRPSGTLTDPLPAPGEGKGTIRGGAYDDDAEDCRAAWRDSARRGSARIGFRFAVGQLPADLR